MACRLERSTMQGVDEFLTIDDLREMFGCGASKARLIMYELPYKKIGSKCLVSRRDLEVYLQRHDRIDCKWPKRKRRKQP